MELPHHLIEEILMLMPVKSLLRFRCVSKSYCSMIDSPSFMYRHIKHSVKSTRKHHLLMMGWGTQAMQLYAASLDLRQPDVTLDSLSTPKMIFNMMHKFIAASCNGLLLLQIPLTEDYILWNPFTRRHKKIPNGPIVHFRVDTPPSPSPIRYKKIPNGPLVYIHDDTKPTLHSGLGYHHVHDDYKVVKIITYFKEKTYTVNYQVNVYSLKLNTWTTVQGYDAENLRGLIGEGVSAGGYVHWLKGSDNKLEENSAGVYVHWLKHAEKLVAFNLCKEEFELVSLPQEHTETSCYHLSPIQESLCLASISRSPADETQVILYRLNHCNGAISGWTKWRMVKQPKVPDRPFDPIVPLVCSHTCVKILLRGYQGRRIFRDMNEKTCSVLRSSCEYLGVFGVVCLESLIKLGEDDNFDGNDPI